jgi:hypothetical protein
MHTFSGKQAGLQKGLGVLLFIYVFLLPEEQVHEAWEHSPPKKKNPFCVIGEHWM